MSFIGAEALEEHVRRVRASYSLTLYAKDHPYLSLGCYLSDHPWTAESLENGRIIYRTEGQSVIPPTDLIVHLQHPYEVDE